MSFADAMREEGRFTRTENGAVALNTSGDARLDLFGTIAVSYTHLTLPTKA